MPNSPLIRFFDTNGDGTGNISMAADFSTTTGIFFIKPATNIDFECSMITFIIDDKNIESDKFGGIDGGLTNGIDVKYCNINFPGGISLGENLAIRKNSDWMFITRHVNIDPIPPGSGKPSRLLINIDLSVFYIPETEVLGLVRGGIPLIGHRGDSLEIIINDDLSSLDEMRGLCRGTILTDSISKRNTGG